MIKIFSLVFELLEFPISKLHLLVAQKLIDKPDYNLISFHPQWFIFVVFKDFILDKISQEEFVAIGDSFGDLESNQVLSPLAALESLQYWLTTGSDIYENSIVLFPKENEWYAKKVFPTLIELLEKKWSQIMFL